MKVKFKPLNMALMFVSCLFINYKLASVGVPDAYIVTFGILYGLLFPWRSFVIEPESKEDSSNEKQ